MKRFLLALTGTVAGLAALLSIKSQGRPLAMPAGGLPSAGLPASTSAAAQPGAVAAPSPTAAGAHRYVGQAVQTRYGTVQVAITVAGKRVTSASFVQLTAFDGHSQQIDQQAAPILLRETLGAQSAHIDTVSGASYTSEGYQRSLQSALDRAALR